MWIGKGDEPIVKPCRLLYTPYCDYMCELKVRRNLQDADVLEKKEAPEEYCRATSEFNVENGGKPLWYHNDIRSNPSFTYIAGQTISVQTKID